MIIKSSWPRELLWLTVDVLIIVLAAAWLIGVRVNLTSSMPLGFYLISPKTAQWGDQVGFCLPAENPYSDLAIERSYLLPGSCPSGSQPLLKSLAGLPGDRVEATAAGISLNGRELPETKRPAHDSQGRPLPSSLLKSGHIPEDMALVISNEHAGGFDSRHFGLVPLASLRRVKPILTFAYAPEKRQPQGE